MRVDQRIDLAHDADRLMQGDDDATVVIDVLGREQAAGLALPGAAVLEPLLAHLVAADVEVPDRLWHADEAADTSSRAALGARSTTCLLSLNTSRSISIRPT